MSRGSRVGSVFGQYELRRLLGKGGMGEVYEAYDRIKDRTVAVKLLPEQLAQDPVYKERFRRESRLAARLQEPHVIPIHDWGEIDGVLYIDMRLVTGQDLRGLLRHSEVPGLGLARSVAFVTQIASALDAAHADGLIHRDVKPENILVTGNDFAYLVDFGIASSATDRRLTSEGMAIGSYAYMAPERFDIGDVNGAVDVYALACVLYECLTGIPPFRADSVSALIRAHLYEQPPRPSMVARGVPAVFDEIITRGLAKNPGDRFASAGALAQAAHQALSGSDRAQASTILSHSFPGAPLPTRHADLGGGTAAPQTRPADPRGTAGPAGQPNMPGQAPWLPAGHGFPPPSGPRPGNQYGPPDWSRPTPAAAPENRRSSLAPVLVTVLVMIVVGLLAVLGWNALNQEPGTGPTTSTSGAPVATLPGSTGTAPTAPTLGAPPPTTAPRTTTNPPQTTTSALPASTAYDTQGWRSNDDARCNYIDQAALIVESETARIVICQTGDDRYYYKAYRFSDLAAVEIDDPYRYSGGWRALNEGVTYDITSSGLTITRAGELLGSDSVSTYIDTGI